MAQKHETPKLIEPYAQGWEANADGKTKGDNPYVPDSGAHAEWDTGFETGETDWQQFCQNEIEKGRSHPAFPAKSP